MSRPVRTVTCSVAGRSIRLSGRHETYLDGIRGADLANWPLLRLASRIPNDAVYLDVGANIGATAIAVALARPDVSVIAFEPSPNNADLLDRNLGENEIRNCVVVRAAVSDLCGMTTINEDGPWSRLGFAGPTVPTTTIDACTRDILPDTPIGLVKIDVEGSEPRVLAGASATFGRWRPPLFIEINPVCLLYQAFDPIAFAAYVLTAFDVEPLSEADRTSPLAIVRDAMLNGGAIDLVLRPRDDAPSIALEKLAITTGSGEPPMGIAEVLLSMAECARRNQFLSMASAQRLEAELHAIKGSHSWRFTAPMRIASRLLHRVTPRH